MNSMGLGIMKLRYNGGFTPAFARKTEEDDERPQSGCLEFFFNGSTAPWGPRQPYFSRLHDHILKTHHTR
jgi:hypothetical protein